MTKKYDVAALGELLIDFTDSGLSEQGNPVLEANPGGAPCNVLSMLANLGRKTVFLGKVGDDGFGHMLDTAIKEQGIDDAGLQFDDKIHTTLALVLKKADGDRDFSFYRNPGADIMLSEDEVDEELIKNSAIFHFGSLSLTDEPVRSATHKAIRIAKENGLLRALQQADILKISDNEIQWFTGLEDFGAGIAKLKEDYPQLKLICLSLGADGSRAYTKDASAFMPAYLQEGTIETTGAGDTFCACMLDAVLTHGPDGLNDAQKLQDMLRRANAAASLVTTRKGALRVMPHVEEIEQFLKTR